MIIIFIFANRKLINHKSKQMTKAEIVSNISDKLGIDKSDVQITIEKFMEEIFQALELHS